MIDIDEFLLQKKAMVIAPAGYGKTTFLASCTRHAEGRQLILTHTHAGIAAIRKKLRENQIESHQFNVETITGFAQKYCLAFDTSGKLPPQEKNKEYFQYVVRRATELLCSPAILSVVNRSYKGMFVDEYQDCTKLQHDFVLKISEVLPTRIFGDHMQGIFDFGGELVDLESDDDMGDFRVEPYMLPTPWRWKQGSANEELGEELKTIRAKLEANEPIDLSDYDNIHHRQIGIHSKPHDLFTKDRTFKECIRKLRDSKNTLVIFPSGDNDLHLYRKPFVKIFGDDFVLVEAVDQSSFYTKARDLDRLIRKGDGGKALDLTYSLLSNLKPILAKKAPVVECEQLLKRSLENMNANLNAGTIAAFFRAAKSVPSVRSVRRELFESICNALAESFDKEISVYEAMSNVRNRVRRIGRRPSSRSVGNPLLTKGLEFETVLIVNAHQFKSRKQLYVAMTRATKFLGVCSPNPVLGPFDK